MRTPQHKLQDALLETGPDVKHYVRVVYIKAMEWRSTTSDTTVQVRWTMCQFAWLVNTQIGYVSPSAVDKLLHHLLK